MVLYTNIIVLKYGGELRFQALPLFYSTVSVVVIFVGYNIHSSFYNVVLPCCLIVKLDVLFPAML